MSIAQLSDRFRDSDLEVNTSSVSWKIRNRKVKIKFQILKASHWGNVRKHMFSTVWGQDMVAKEWTQFTFCHTSNLIIDAVLELSQTAPLQEFHETSKFTSSDEFRFSQLNFPKIQSYYTVDVLNVSESSELAGTATDLMVHHLHNSEDLGVLQTHLYKTREDHRHRFEFYQSPYYRGLRTIVRREFVPRTVSVIAK